MTANLAKYLVENCTPVKSCSGNKNRFAQAYFIYEGLEILVNLESLEIMHTSIIKNTVFYKLQETRGKK